jgi:hypothetical protein
LEKTSIFWKQSGNAFQKREKFPFKSGVKARFFHRLCISAPRAKKFHFHAERFLYKFWTQRLLYLEPHAFDTGNAKARENHATAPVFQSITITNPESDSSLV